MPIRRKKRKYGSILWSYDSSLKISTKRVFQTEDKIKDWPLLDSEEIIYRVNSIEHELFYHNLIKAISKLKTLELRFKFIWALKRYPEDKDKLFVIFLHSKEITDDEEIEIFHKNKLILAYFAGYYIITRNGITDAKFLCTAIEFYERFDHLVLPDKTKPFLLFGIKTPEDSTLLFFSDVKGNGMLIKSKSSDTKISPEREIEILRLGSILGVDVPKRAALIMLDPEDEIINEFSSYGNNILIQRLIPGAFPLYSASEKDIENIVRQNCVNLGRMLIFDIITGSWDRHSGNYVLHPKDNNPLKTNYSLSEIDFGHFNPAWYPPADFLDIEIEDIDENNPPMISKREGWALTRHPLVTEMINRCDESKVIKGIDQSFISLKNFINKHDDNLQDFFSPLFLSRILDIFKPDTKVKKLFEREIDKLKISIDINRDIFVL